jgi:DNA invertase Pin-like site-specific DNA recombinase
MNALKPRPPFQVLIMSEESRLRREAIETAYALKQLVTAGVRVFFYLEDRERTLDSPTDKIMLSLTAFADELEREKARQRTYDAMLRKAKAGHVTGVACSDTTTWRSPDLTAGARTLNACTVHKVDLKPLARARVVARRAGRGG